MPSLELQQYLQARADGVSVEDAAFESGIGLKEAELWEADIASGEMKLPEPSRAYVHAHEAPTNSEPKNITENIPEREEPKMVNGTVAGDELRLLIERVERITEEIKGLNEDKSDVFQEAKSRGFDTAAIKRVIKLRKMEPHVRDEAGAVLALYLSAIGMEPVEHALGLAA